MCSYKATSEDMSDVRQKEKSKYLVLRYSMYVESRKTVQMNLFPGQEQRRRLREQTRGHQAPGRREGGMN